MMKSARVAFWRSSLGGLLLFELFVLFGWVNLQPTFTTLGLMITAIAGWATLEWVSIYLRQGASKLLPWWVVCIVVGAVYLDAAGDFIHLYDRIRFFDAILHLIIPFIFGVCLIWVLRIRHAALPQSLIVWLGVTITVSFGTLYEIEEYLEDVFTGSNRFGDAFDTGSDLVLDVLGAALAGVVAWYKKP